MASATPRIISLPISPPTPIMTNIEVRSSAPPACEEFPKNATIKTIDQLVTDAENAMQILEQLGPVQDQRPKAWPRAIVHPHPVRDRWWFDSRGVDFGRIPEAKNTED